MDYLEGSFGVSLLKIAVGRDGFLNRYFLRACIYRKKGGNAGLRPLWMKAFFDLRM